MRPMSVVHDLDRKSIKNLCLLRARVSVLKDTAKDKTTDYEEIRGALNFIYYLKSSKCAGKFVRRVFNKYHILNFHDFEQKMNHLAKKFPTRSMPLHDMVKSSYGSETLIVHFYKRKHYKFPSPIVIQDDIPRSTGLKVANDLQKLIKAKVPKHYLTNYNAYL